MNLNYNPWKIKFSSSSSSSLCLSPTTLYVSPPTPLCLCPTASVSLSCNDIDTRKLFFNVHIKPHIDYASVMWDGCSVVLKKRLNAPHRRAAKLILLETTLTTDKKLKEMRIMSLQKQTEYNKGLFMYRLFSNEAPEYISNLYTHILPHAIPTLGTITVVCLGQG